MKKVLVLLMCVFLLAGCKEKETFAENTTCEDIMQAAITATKAPEYDNIYRMKDNSFNSTDMSLWANGLYEESKDFDLISDCAIYLAAGNITYEVGVIKPKNAEDLGLIVEIFENRKKTISGSNKAAYDPDFSNILNDCKIYVDDGFAIMLLTNDNTSAKKEIDKLKSAN